MKKIKEIRTIERHFEYKPTFVIEYMSGETYISNGCEYFLIEELEAKCKQYKQDYNTVLKEIKAAKKGALTTCGGMFYGCKDIPDITNLDVSNVEYMSCMFSGCTNFNQDIGKWNVSNVEYMSCMFYGCTNFNQDIGKWNVSNVKSMRCMFSGCTNFNQDIGKWNVSNVKFMSSVFSGCANFNQDIGKWNVSNVKFMGSVFSGCGIKYENKPKKLLK